MDGRRKERRSEGKRNRVKRLGSWEREARDGRSRKVTRNERRKGRRKGRRELRGKNKENNKAQGKKVTSRGRIKKI